MAKEKDLCWREAEPAPVPPEKKIKKAKTCSAANSGHDTQWWGGRNLGKSVAGFIFLCSTRTKGEYCFKRHVFGLHAARLEAVERIREGAELFLFDYELKLLYGVYQAASDGGLDLEASDT
ncbi:hypothetical protein Taro_049464 [Colocasia esculenta]|uniref:DCD domain-containing protein n=1 Tax=Colocasia esculenta TaxID=4460 RepID=A0A843XAX1_COLES|nr:hypothetical protein [Colocasia esculenta]